LSRREDLKQISETNKGKHTFYTGGKKTEKEGRGGIVTVSADENGRGRKPK
jgi:hypothetical protein